MNYYFYFIKYLNFIFWGFKWELDLIPNLKLKIGLKYAQIINKINIS